MSRGRSALLRNACQSSAHVRLSGRRCCRASSKGLNAPGVATRGRAAPLPAPVDDCRACRRSVNACGNGIRSFRVARGLASLPLSPRPLMPFVALPNARTLRGRRRKGSALPPVRLRFARLGPTLTDSASTAMTCSGVPLLPHPAGQDHDDQTQCLDDPDSEDLEGCVACEVGVVVLLRGVCMCFAAVARIAGVWRG